MKEFNLNDRPKRQPYQVPDGYFDRLPMRVMERTAQQEDGAPARGYSQLWRPLRLALVPLVLLLVIVGVYYTNLPTGEQPFTQQVSIAALSDEEILEYLNSYAMLETTDFEEHSVAEQDMAADFLNVNAELAEQELDYYRLDEINL